YEPAGCDPGADVPRAAQGAGQPLHLDADVHEAASDGGRGCGGEAARSGTLDVAAGPREGHRLLVEADCHRHLPVACAAAQAGHQHDVEVLAGAGGQGQLTATRATSAARIGCSTPVSSDSICGWKSDAR